MKLSRILLAGVFATCLSTVNIAAQAETPAEVLEPYKAYHAAITVKDFSTAVKHAKIAWEQAETLMGEDGTTGVLAFNYATVLKLNEGKTNDVRKAYERSIALAHLSGDTAPTVRLQREVALGQYLISKGKESAFNKRFEQAIAFAETNNLGGSTYAGELYTLRSQTTVSRRSHQKTEKYAEKALEIFNKTDDEYVTYYPYLAHLYSGYGKEGQKDFVPAIMEYQHVMQDLEGELPKDHPFMMRALGRWMTMRDRIVREGLKEEAEAAGMCDCWPYDKPRNEKVRPIKRKPPEMPSGAWQSGFSIVEFDIDDDGNTVNPRVLESWPKDIWEKSAVRAVKKWQYSPRTPEEVDSDRTDLIVTLRYVLKDSFGRIIE